MKKLILGFVLTLFANFTFASDETATLQDNTRKTQLELSTTLDSLNNNYDSWQSYQLAAQHQFAPRTLIYGELKHSKRFSQRDENIQIGSYYPLSDALTINAELNVSPTHNVLPNHTELISLSYAIGNGFVVGGGFKHGKYPSVSLNQVPLSVEYYFGNFRVGYTPSITRVFGKNLVSHRLVGSYYYNDASYITIGFSDGKEADQINDQFLKYNVSSYGVYGRHWMNQDWAVSWDANHTRQGDLFDRDEVTLGIRRAF